MECTPASCRYRLLYSIHVHPQPLIPPPSLLTNAPHVRHSTHGSPLLRPNICASLPRLLTDHSRPHGVATKPTRTEPPRTFAIVDIDKGCDPPCTRGIVIRAFGF